MDGVAVSKCLGQALVAPLAPQEAKELQRNAEAPRGPAPFLAQTSCSQYRSDRYLQKALLCQLAWPPHQ